MKKGIRKLIVLLLVLTVTMAFSGMSAFADGEGSTEQELAVNNVFGMFKPTAAKLITNGDSMTLELTYASASYDKAYVGTAHQAVFDADPSKIVEKKDNKYLIPVETIGETFPVAFHSVSKEGWYDRDFMIELGDTPTLTTDNPGTPVVLDSYAVEWDNEVSVAASFTTFNIAASKVIVENDGTATISLKAGNSKRLFPKIALISQDASVEEKEAAAIEGIATEDGNNNYIFNFSVPISDLGKPIPLSTYQIYNGTEEWKNWSDQKYLTINSASVVNQLISKIQVQKNNELTESYMNAAKTCWLALDDEAKLEDDGYFSEDTGDASLDDPRNQDEIGEKELLVVSFGTSYNGSRVATVKAVEDALQEAYPDYSVRRAFTAQIIINHIQARDGEVIDNMDQALERAVSNGVKELVVQPTHLMHGYEYDEMCEALKAYEDKFDRIIISEPLLNTDADKKAVAQAVVEKAALDAGFTDVETAVNNGAKAFVFMGHGTSHEANATYTQMQSIMDELGYKNCFVGTVEGEPEPTEVNNVLAKVTSAGYIKVALRPLMVVAGDHANNDMAGDDEDSWKSIFGAALGADNVECQINGLGEIEAVQQLYVSHVDEAIREANRISITDAKVTGIKDKTYTGKALTQDLKVTYGDAALVENTDYTVEYANNVNAGTATITLTGIDNYKGTLEKTFTINPKKITPKVKLSKTAYTYNGKTNKPTVTVYNGTTKLSSKNYTVSIKGRKNVGRNAVKVTLKGNYKGTKTVYFKVNPKKATIKTPAATKTTVTVKWKAQKDKMSAERITGYQVQLATNKAFTKGLKDVTVKGYTKTSKKFKNLKAKKTYYVRVRTYKVISKKYYYSAWSTVKTIKTPAK